MPKNMFGDVVDPSVKMGNKSGYTVVLTMIAEVLVIALVVIVPLMASGALPALSSSMTYTVTAIKLPSPPPPPAPPREKVAPPETSSNPDIPPRETPTGFKPETPRDDRDFEKKNTITGSVPGDGPPDFTPPEPPPVPKAPTEPIRVGGEISPPQKVRHVNPAYPPIAQSARVQGIVIIEATIGPDGTVQNARVLRSIPLLDAAALEAVRQWQFTPTLLNKQPVPVVMTVTVQFTLQ